MAAWTHTPAQKWGEAWVQSIMIPRFLAAIEVGNTLGGGLRACALRPKGGGVWLFSLTFSPPPLNKERMRENYMINSENDLKTHAQEYVKNEAYIPQLLNRKFSPTEAISFNDIHDPSES